MLRRLLACALVALGPSAAAAQDLAAVAVDAVEAPVGKGPCGAEVTAWLHAAGHADAPDGAAALWTWVQARGTTRDDPWPEVGDVAFFTDDAGRPAHAAVVMAARADGTAILAHPHHGSPVLHLNLYRPDVAEADGEPLNGRLGGALAASRFLGWGAPPAPTGPPERPDTPAPRRGPLARVLGGTALPASELAGASCLDLWYLRNAVAARHGLPFDTPEAAAVFAAEPWYRPDPAVDLRVLRARLTPADQATLRNLTAAERQRRCR